MVVVIKDYRQCDRCGATKQEAPLTRSHAPSIGLLKQIGYTERQKLVKTYCLCERCRQVHYDLERRAIYRFAVELARLHEDYLNQ